MPEQFLILKIYSFVLHSKLQGDRCIERHHMQKEGETTIERETSKCWFFPEMATLDRPKPGDRSQELHSDHLCKCHGPIYLGIFHCFPVPCYVDGLEVEHPRNELALICNACISRKQPFLQHHHASPHPCKVVFLFVCFLACF